MANTVKVNITADASGAIRATGQTVQGLDNVSKSAKKAAKDTENASKDKQKSAQKTAKSMTALGGSMQALGIPGGALIARANQMRTTFGTLSASSKALRISLIALPFVAIALAVMTLFKAFTSTQKGADRLNRVLEPLRAIMQALWGQVQNLSIALFDAFTNPKQAVKDFANTIRDFFIRRITETLDGISGLGSALVKLFKGDFKGALQEAGEAAVNLTTGLNPLAGLIRDGIDASKEFAQEMAEAARVGARIQELQEEIEQTIIDQTRPMAEMRRQYQELRNQARDTTLTEQERLKAAEDAVQLLRDQEAEQQRLLDMQIEQLQLQNSLNDTDREAQLELEQLLAKRDELAANTERQMGRLVARIGSLTNSIEESARADEEASIAYVNSLRKRADEFRDVLLTETELRERALEEQFEQLEYFVEQEVLTRQEADEIIAQMRRQANEERLQEELALVDRLREVALDEEQALAEQYERELEQLRELHASELLETEEFNQLRLQLEQEYLEALDDLKEEYEEREMERSRQGMRRHAEYLQDRLRNEELTADEIANIQAKLAEMEQGHIQIVAGEALAAGIAKAESAAEAGRAIIQSLAREAGAAAARAVFQALPFPANAALAPIAAAAAERLVGQFANFASGGRVGDRFGVRGRFGQGDNRLIAANDNEVILNQAQQQAIGQATLARAGVPGFAGGSVSLDASGFNDAVSRMRDNINVNIDIVDITRKINDQNRLNTERDIDVR